MNASKVGQSLFLRDRDLSCVQAVRYTCLFGNNSVRPTRLSADDRFSNRLTVQTRVDKSVRYFSLRHALRHLRRVKKFMQFPFFFKL